MKITKQKLAEIIKEEIVDMINENVGQTKDMSGGDFTQATRDLGKSQGADPKEKAVVTKLAQDLMAAAKKSNIRGGNIGTLLQRVFSELEKMGATGGEQKDLQEIDLFGTKEKRLQGQADHYIKELQRVKAEAVEIMKAVARDPNVGGMETQLQYKLLQWIRDNDRLFARSDADFASTGEDTYREPKE
jgi:hypothetical protein